MVVCDPHHISMSICRELSEMTDLHGNAIGIKKEDSGAQENSFPDPIVLFIYRFNCSHGPLMYLQ